MSPTKMLAGDCELSFFLSSLVGRRPNPQREESLLRGRKIHKHIENAIDGVPIPSDTEEGQFAMHALPTIRTLPADVKREERMMLVMGAYGLDATADILSDSARLITDWKSSSDPAKYALKADALRADVQALSLAFLAMVQRGWDVAKLKWVYLPTKPKKNSRVVEATLTRADVLERFPAIDVKARRRLAILSNPFPEVKACFSECDKYRGCDHLAYCPAKNSLKGALRNDGETLMAIDQSVIDAIKAKLGGTAQPAAPAAAPVDPQVAALMAAGLSPEQIAQVLGTQPAAAPPQPPATSAAADIQAMLAKAGVGTPAAVAAVAPSGTAVDAAVAAAIAAQAKPAAVAAPSAAPSARKIGVLYVDCIPQDGTSRVDAADILREVNTLVARDAGLQHFALAEYGKGAALVAIAVADVMTRHTGDVICLRQPQALTDALRAHATSVVWGCK